MSEDKPDLHDLEKIFGWCSKQPTLKTMTLVHREKETTRMKSHETFDIVAEVGEKSADAYLNFICNAVIGGWPKDVDIFFNKHRYKILKVANKLRERFPVDIIDVYRGILLEDKDINSNLTLKPNVNFQYLSFTEDKEVALDFANTNSFMSTVVMLRQPNSKGYLIEYTPDEAEILFHHKWKNIIHLDRYLEGNKSIRIHKEVILRQTMKTFRLIRVEPKEITKEEEEEKRIYLEWEKQNKGWEKQRIIRNFVRR